MFRAPQVRFVPNGIDATDWALLDIDRARAKAWRDANLAAGRRVVGLFGHLKQKKGGMFFLDAVEASACRRELHLLIVGEIEPAMSVRLEALGPEIAWSHVPFVDRFELLPWYACCDLVALPSLYDGMPNVLLEAGALAVPVLASTAGGMADVFGAREAVSALAFAPGDAYACRRALDLAMQLPAAELQALGRELQARVLADFDARTEAQRYHELLLETTSGREETDACHSASHSLS
jgi:glycosyltransferase involved in cell wall biosynthesis